jgi:hypothetical protein
MTDIKQTCTRLIELWDADCDIEVEINELRAALAEPEPEGPTDEALDELFTEIDQNGEPESWRVFARAVLARWGNHPGSPDSSTQPIPVTERLPGPEDCDAEGKCWWWYPPVPEQTYGYWAHEHDAVPERAVDEQPSHWLPAHALPLPS